MMKGINKTMKRVLSSALTLTMIGSMVSTVFASVNLPQELPPTDGSTFTSYQNENYQGDFLPTFQNNDCWGNGTLSTVYKTADPLNHDNSVLMVAGEGKTDTLKGPYNTAVALYQGSQTTEPTYNKGYMIYQTKAYLANGMKNYIAAYKSFLQPSSTKTAMNSYAALAYLNGDNGAYLYPSTTTQFKVASNVISSKYYAVNYNAWNTYTFVFDYKTNNGLYYINGTLVYSRAVASKPKVTVGIEFITIGGTQASPKLVPQNMLYFDDTICYYYIPAPGAEAVFNSAAGKVTISFKTEATGFDASNIVIKKNGVTDDSGVVTGVTLAADKLSGEVTVDTGKLSQGGYTMNITGVKDCYDQDVTLAEDVDLTLPAPGAALTFDSAAKTVRLNFATGVNADLTDLRNR